MKLTSVTNRKAETKCSFGPLLPSAFCLLPLFKKIHNVHNHRMVLLLIAVFALFTGCANEMKKGQKDLERGRFETAVVHFEAAVNETRPKDVTLSARALALAYHQSKMLTGSEKCNVSIVKLAEALERAANWNYDKAVAAYAQARQFTAKGFLQQSLSYLPEMPKALALLETVEQASAQALLLKGQAQELAGQQQWDQAVQAMAEALKNDRTLPSGEATLKRIKQDAYQWYCAAAQRALDRDARAEVKTQVAHACQFAEGSEVKHYLQVVKNRDQADEVMKKAAREFEQQHYEKAVALYGEAEELFPQMPGLPVKQLDAKQHLCDQYIATGKHYLVAYEFFDALRQFTLSQSVLPQHGRVSGYIAAVKERIAEQQVSQSRDYRAQGMYGNAILYQVLSLNYQPLNTTVARELEETIASIEKEIEYTIGFVGFQSSAADRSVADRGAAAALQHLNRVKPGNVLVKDLSTLRRNSAMQGLSLDDLMRTEAGIKQGVDAVIAGSLLENSVRVISRTTYGESEYQAGVRTIPNPDYGKAVTEFNRASQQLQEAQQSYQTAQQMLSTAQSIHQNDPSTVNQVALAVQTGLCSQARGEVSRCQQRMNMAQNVVNTTPRQVTVPDMRKHKYPIYHKTKLAKVTFLVKMLDTATGAVLFTDQFDGQYSQVDQTIDGDTAHNVPADPWDVPEDASMTDRALVELTGSLNRSIELATQKHGHRFVLLMREAERKKDTEGAVENVMKYLFAYPVQPEDTERMMKGLEPVIAKQADYINLSQLLRQHCGIMRGWAQLPAPLSDVTGKLLIQKKQGVKLGFSLPCELIAIEGKPVKSVRDVEAVLRPYGPGEEVAISVTEKGRQQTQTVRLVPAL